MKKFKTEISEKDKTVTKDAQSSDQNSNGGSPETAPNDLPDLPETADDEVTTDSLQPTNHDWRNLLVIEKPHFFFNILQTAVLILMTILVHKMKYILTPFLCLVASTFPLKNWVPKSYGLWTVYIIIMASCVADRGLHNIKEQYSFKGNNDTQLKQLDDNIYDMLNWITTNTDDNAVFAGEYFPSFTKYSFF